MPEPFIVFQQFNDIALANGIAEVLQRQGIETVIEGVPALVDPTIVGVSNTQAISIKLRSGDFSKAHQALADFYKKQLDQVDKDYYLLQFTNEELMEIIAKPDEWGAFDYQLAKKLLKDRGHEVQPAAAGNLARERINALAQPDNIHPAWIYIGYITAVLGGLGGIIIGITLLYSKKTLPDGQRIFAYNDNVRAHAKIITIISFTVLTIAFVFRLLVVMGYIVL
jgi:hypothetical protein